VFVWVGRRPCQRRAAAPPPSSWPQELRPNPPPTPPPTPSPSPSPPPPPPLTPQEMKRALFLYAKLNPGLRYIQGMNELLAPLYYMFKTDPDRWAGALLVFGGWGQGGVLAWGRVGAPPVSAAWLVATRPPKPRPATQRPPPQDERALRRGGRLLLLRGAHQRVQVGRAGTWQRQAPKLWVKPSALAWRHGQREPRPRHAVGKYLTPPPPPPPPRDHFCQQLDNSTSGIRATIGRLMALLKAVDPQVADHLEKNKVGGGGGSTGARARPPPARGARSLSLVRTAQTPAAPPRSHPHLHPHPHPPPPPPPQRSTPSSSPSAGSRCC
jgi:hypothetical protein